MAFLTNLKEFSWLYFIIALTIVYFFFNLELTAVKNQRDNAIGQVSQLTAQLAIQNSAIKQWHAEADVEAAKAKKYQDQANAMIQESQKQVSDVMAMTVPAGCEDAMSWGREQATRMKP